MSLNISAIVHINWKFQMTPLSLTHIHLTSHTSAITTLIFRMNLQYFIFDILYLSIGTRVIVIADQYVTSMEEPILPKMEVATNKSLTSVRLFSLSLTL